MKTCDAICFNSIKCGLEEAVSYERGELDANTTRVTVPTPEKQGEIEADEDGNPYNIMV